MKNIIILGLLGLMLGIVGCATKTESGKTATGIEYKIFHKGKGTPKIKNDDVIDYHFMVLSAKDSILQSSFTANMPQMGMPFKEITDKKQLEGNFQARLLNNFKLLAEGDSAIFKVPTDTIFALTESQFKKAIEQEKSQMTTMRTSTNIPDSIKAQQIQQMGMKIKQMEGQYEKLRQDLPKGKYITFVFKVLKVKNKEQVEKEQKEMAKKQEEQMKEMMKKQEEEAKKQLPKDAKIIEEYIKKNNLKTQVTASGLHYIITKEGTGDKPAKGDIVKVNYAGKLLDGKVVFDTSVEEVAKANNINQPGRKFEPFSFTLGVGQVIKGWDEGIALLKKGTKATLIIPSPYAYGPQGNPPTIPANAVLLFDVELVDFQKAQNPADKGLK